MALLLCSAFVILSPSNDAFAATVQLPQTGQTTCYDSARAVIGCAGTGQDGDKRMGLPWPNPRFTNTDGTSPITGDIILDRLTGLEWPKDAGTQAQTCITGDKEWQDALDYVACLNAKNYLGHSDWRLPNINELRSLVHSGYKEEMCGSSACASLSNWLYSKGFFNVWSYPYRYWSSTTSARETGAAWHVSMGSGYVYGYSMSLGFLNDGIKDYDYWVWPVRGGQSGLGNLVISKTGQTTSYAVGDDGDLEKGAVWPNPRFTNNGNGTVTDNLTGLIWLKNANCFGTKAWGQALASANNLVSGQCGLTDGSQAGDWRLPNREEMASLIDFGYYRPALSNAAGTGKWTSGNPFNNASEVCWSSTTAGSTGYAWSVDMDNGFVYYYYKSDNYCVWPVRGGQSGSFGNLAVTTSAGLTSSGTQGGPFSPASVVYTLQNTGGTSINWTATNSQSWMTLSSTSGTLTAGASTQVTVSINSGANSLTASGSAYVDTVTFTNTTNGSGNTTRAVSLTVNASAGTLSVTPSTILTSIGSQGGPFSPASVTYTLQNTGGTSIDWTATNNQTWVSLSPANGTLAAGASTEVSVSINNSVANSLAASGSAYVDTVNFRNTTNGNGNTTRAVSLSINFTLTVTTNGAGRVKSDPAGISCGGGAVATCSASFAKGTSVTLTATPATSTTGNVTFLGWAGGMCSGTGLCTVIMNADTSVTATFTDVVAANFNFANIDNISDYFTAWFDLKTDGVATDQCKKFLVIADNTGGKAMQMSQIDCVYQNPTTGRHKVRMLVMKHADQPNDRARYIENGKFYLCTNALDDVTDPTRCSPIAGAPADFSVYGTTFDISKHAWKFANGDWSTKGTSDRSFKIDIHEASDVVADYLPDFKKDDFFDAIGRFSLWENSWTKDSQGLCYGLANSAIANYTHQDNSAWGTDTFSADNWKRNIDLRSYETDKPTSPFGKNGNLYTDLWLNNDRTVWTVESAKKIMYHFVTQPSYSNDGNWVGEDGVVFLDNDNAEEVFLHILKVGAPVSFGFRNNDPKGGHRVAVTQALLWDVYRKFMIWDNNYPLGNKELTPDYGPYLELYLNSSVDYKNMTDSKGEPVYRNAFNIRATRILDGNGDNARLRSLYRNVDLLYFLPSFGCDDSQNIYNEWSGNCPQLANANVLTSVSESVVDYPHPGHMRVLLIGGQVNTVTEKDTGLPVTFVPEGELLSEQAVSITSGDDIYTTLFLPVAKTYTIQATKYVDFPGLKAFVTIPNSDGTVQKLNYENLSTGEADATGITFTVGRGNANTGISRTIVQDIYNSDYNANLSTSINPPTNLKAAINSSGTGVALSWTNTGHPLLASVLVICKEGAMPYSSADGVTVFNGTGQEITDIVSPNTIYYYAAYSRDTAGNLSAPTITQVNTGLRSVFGRVTLTAGGGLGNAILELEDSGGNVISTTSAPDGTYALSNLANGVYTLEASHQSADITNPSRAITLSGNSQQEDFSATNKKTLILLFDSPAITAGNTIAIPWTYRNIGNDETVDVMLFRNGSWETLVSGVTILNGKITWTVTGPEVQSAKLRISLVSNPAIFDEHSFSLDPNENETHTLNAAKSGTGNGTVTSSLSGINCGGTCSASYNLGTNVTLTATPAGDSIFSGWSGACTGIAPTCLITMDTDESVTAHFLPEGTTSFNDVPSGYWAWNYIEALLNNNITSGCGGGNYCPESLVTRGQMAVFVVKALGEQPVATCTGTVFNDVNANMNGGEGFCRYVEKFRELNITAGCAVDNSGTPQNEAAYCPDSNVTRAQMAVFLTKALAQQPAATCTGTVFNDVNAGMNGGDAFCRYIEKFRELNITAGCAANNSNTPDNEAAYCPDNSVTRAQMAVFLTKGFLQ